MTSLKAGNAAIRVDGGELISYTVDDYQFIHQKGSPGWRNSDTEMFPIIGPTALANFQVQTPRDMAIQDQHGLLREMNYELIGVTENQAVFEKRYTANTRIKNSKYPEKSTKEYVFWPYDFVFTKRFFLDKDSLLIVFTIDAPRDTPFMLGYHPAFKLNSSNPVVMANEAKIALEDIMAAGSQAYEVANCEQLTLIDSQEMHIQTEGFGNFMLWTEVPNMLCIEPITFYPYKVAQKELHEGFQYTHETPLEFKVRLSTKSK